MHLRDQARAIIESDRLADKLAPLVDPDDEVRGPPVRLASPGRPANLAIAPARAARVPPVAGMRDPAQRARILHALANHELQAVELFAWALLAFPDAPARFRRGLVAILGDEQRHFGLYHERLASLGHGFGDFPVTGHFWHQLGALGSPLDFVCVMGLTFENANLDFAGDYGRAARAAGDLATAAALEVVHADEIRHVRFAARWLAELKPAGASAWQTFVATLRPPLSPARARGRELDRAAREAAGLEPEFIAELERVAPTRPSGEPR